MESVRPMYNAHPYFSLKNRGNKCTLYMAKYSNKIEKLKQSGSSTDRGEGMLGASGTAALRANQLEPPPTTGPTQKKHCWE